MAKQKQEFSEKDISLIQEYMDEKITDKPVPGRVIFTALINKISVQPEQAVFCAMLSVATRDGRVVGFEGRIGRNGGYVKTGTPKSQKKSVPPPPPPKLIVPPNLSERVSLLGKPPKPEPKPEESEDTDPELEPVPTFVPEPELPTEPSPPPPPSDPVSAARTWGKTRNISSAQSDIPCQAWKRIQKVSVDIGNRHYAVPMATCDVRELIIRVLKGQYDESGPIEFNDNRYSVPDLDMLERFLLCFFEATLTLGEKVA